MVSTLDLHTYNVRLTRSMTSKMAQSYPGSDFFTQNSINAMYHATADDRGTVQALARELDDADKDGMWTDNYS